MPRFPGERSSIEATLVAVGAWLHPVSSFRRRSEAEHQVQFRVGVVGLVCMVTGALAVVTAILTVIAAGGDPLASQSAFGPATLPAAIGLVIISVFAPQAIFRTRNAALTREVLSNPSTPIRPWRSTTISFDAVLVGALLAGLYFDAALTMTLFGLAFVGRVVFLSRRKLAADPNARFHGLALSWTAAVTGAAAFVIVKPLSASVSAQGSILPLLFAALVAMYLGLAFNSVERWVTGDRTRWAFARDAVDTRRIVVAIISALIAWLVAIVGLWVGENAGGASDIAGSLTGLGILLASWLMLWFVSIRIWRRDALRTISLWSAHQAEIVARLTDGSLSPDLAARAALPTTTRMAVSIFGATRAMAIVDDGRGSGHATCARASGLRRPRSVRGVRGAGTPVGSTRWWPHHPQRNRPPARAAAAHQRPRRRAQRPPRRRRACQRLLWLCRAPGRRLRLRRPDGHGAKPIGRRSGLA